MDSDLLNESLNILRSVFSVNKYFCLNNHRPENIALAFNGGKDGMVLLHLCRKVMIDLNMPRKDVVVFNIVLPDSFKEVDQFAAKAAEEYPTSRLIKM